MLFLEPIKGLRLHESLQISLTTRRAASDHCPGPTLIRVEDSGVGVYRSQGSGCRVWVYGVRVVKDSQGRLQITVQVTLQNHLHFGT